MAISDRSPTAGRVAASATHWTPWGLLASLVLPAILGVAAAVLGWGGVIDGLQTDERERAERLVEQLERQVLDRLATAEDRAGSVFAFQRTAGEEGAQNRVGTPFVDAPDAEQIPARPALDSAALTLLEIAAVMERQGEVQQSLELMGRAAEIEPVAEWDGPHRLVRARVRVRIALAAGTESSLAFAPLLELLRARSPIEWVDQVSLPALAAVSGIRIARAAAQPDWVERFQSALWTVAVPMDARFASAWTRQDVFDPELEVCRQFARVVTVLDDPGWRDLPAETDEHSLIALTDPGGGGYALVTRERVLVLASEALVGVVRQVAKSIGSSPAAAEYRWSVLPSTAEVDRALASSTQLPVVLLGTTQLPSARLLRLRWWLVGAAVLALIVGQFLVWRSVRREAELGAMRSDFVDLVGHELRTPLSVLTAKAEMLAHGDVPAGKQRDYQQSVYRAALRLGEQVNQVLDFSRLEKGEQPIELQVVPARDLIASALRKTRDALAWAGQRVRVDVPRELPSVHVDAELVVQALNNLLHNAMRHAPGARIEVRAVAAASVTKLLVLDEGPGLGATDPDELFVAFRRGEQRKAPGTGLGLAIVARSMKAVGGSVKAWNRATAIGGDGTGGAAFELTLPNAQENPS